MRNQTINELRPATWRAWGALLDSVMAGMRDISRVLGAAVVDAYDFREARCVVDVGGGQGTLLAAILQAFSTLRGVLFDQPQVVETAKANLRTLRVAGRCEIVGGSFFEQVPAGGDVYFLQHIIHNWDDDAAVRILGVCRRATGESSKVVLSERPITLGNAFQPAKFADVTMMVAFDGARERTVDEYAALLAGAGFKLTRTIQTLTDHTLIEGVPI